MNDFKLDFVGIGGMKCATTWVYACLNEHPEICFPHDGVSNVKELHFFNKKHYRFKDVEVREYEDKGFDWYKGLFKHCKGIKGEITPSYLSCPTACERIKKHFPNTKIIAVLRNPVDRAYSEYLHNVREGFYPKGTTFRQALDMNNDTVIDKSLYGKYLQNYIDSFDKVKIIFYEDIKSKPKEVIQDLYQFLEVNSDFVPSNLNKKVNVQRQARIPWINTMITKGIHFVRHKNLKTLHKILLKMKVNRLVAKVKNSHLKGSKKKVSKEDREYFQNIFKEDIKKLEEITKRDLSNWLILE